MNKSKTLREKLRAGMLRGKWYVTEELRQMTGGEKASIGSLLERMRNTGEVVTEQKIGGGPKRYRMMFFRKPELKRKKKQPLNRALFQIEKLPIDEVRAHLPLVSQDEVWRGKTWDDMPGSEDLIRKCNFFFFRRGLLKWDHMRPHIKSSYQAQGLA